MKDDAKLLHPCFIHLSSPLHSSFPHSSNIRGKGQIQTYFPLSFSKFQNGHLSLILFEHIYEIFDYEETFIFMESPFYFIKVQRVYPQASHALLLRHSQLPGKLLKNGEIQTSHPEILISLIQSNIWKSMLIKSSQVNPLCKLPTSAPQSCRILMSF